MRSLIESLNEAYSDNRAIPGNVLEVELGHDGSFFWYTPNDSEWNKFKKMKDWEVNTDEMPERFFIKIGMK